MNKFVAYMIEHLKLCWCMYAVGLVITMLGIIIHALFPIGFILTAAGAYFVGASSIYTEVEKTLKKEFSLTCKDPLERELIDSNLDLYDMVVTRRDKTNYTVKFIDKEIRY